MIIENCFLEAFPPWLLFDCCTHTFVKMFFLWILKRKILSLHQATARNSTSISMSNKKNILNSPRTRTQKIIIQSHNSQRSAPSTDGSREIGIKLIFMFFNATIWIVHKWKRIKLFYCPWEWMEECEQASSLKVIVRSMETASSSTKIRLEKFVKNLSEINFRCLSTHKLCHCAPGNQAKTSLDCHF